MADENRLHDLLDLIDQARREGDKETETKATAAYRRESAPPEKQPGYFPDASQNPHFKDPGLPSLPGNEPPRPAAPPKKRGVADVLGDIGDAGKEIVGPVIGPAIKGIAGVGENLLSGASGLIKSGNNIAGTLLTGRHQPALPLPEYHPQTEGGKAIEQSPAVQLPGKAVNALGDKVGEVTGEPAAGELTKDFANLLLPKVGAEVVSGVKGAVTPKAAPTVSTPITETPVESLRAAGYKVRPSDAAKAAPETGRKIGVNAEGLAGSDSLRKTMLMSNQKKTTSYGAQHVGLPAETPRLTDKLFDQQAEAPMAKYRDVGRALPQFNVSEALGPELDAITEGKGLSPKARRAIGADVNQYRSSTMTGPDAVKTISVLRRRAAKEQASDDVNTNDLGDAHRAVADSLENELERQLAAVGDDKLINEYRDARTQLAKINDIRTATKGGQVDAKVLHRLAQKGAPLSGYAKIVADAYEMAPHVLEHPQSIKTVGDSVTPAVSAAADIGTLGIRPAVRAVLNSDLYQNRLGKSNQVGPGAGLGDYFASKAEEGPKGPVEPPPNGPAGRPPRLGGPPPSPFKPSRERTMLEAQKRSGDLSLADELLNPQQLPEAPSRLTAETPPATHGDIPFKASQPQAVSLADALGLGDEPVPTRDKLPKHAASQAGDLELKENARVEGGPNKPERGSRPSDDTIDLESESPQGPFAHTRGGVDLNGPRALGEFYAPDQMREAGQYLQKPHGLTLEGEQTGGIPFKSEGPKSAPPQGGSPAPGTNGPASGAGFDLKNDLGIEIKPSAKGGFELRTPGEKTATRYPTEKAARQAALSLADQLLGDLEPPPASKPRVKNDPESAGKGELPPNAFDHLFAKRNPIENNASGESSASVEAINRVALEKAAKQGRYVIEPNGEVRPLIGVDSVDATAKPGQVIVQRGVGDKPYTVLDRGGRSKKAAENRITMVLDQLNKSE